MALLSYNSHTILFTHSKYTIQWFLVYSELCHYQHNQFRTFHHPKKKLHTHYHSIISACVLPCLSSHCTALFSSNTSPSYQPTISQLAPLPTHCRRVLTLLSGLTNTKALLAKKRFHSKFSLLPQTSSWRDESMLIIIMMTTMMTGGGTEKAFTLCSQCIKYCLF